MSLKREFSLLQVFYQLFCGTVILHHKSNATVHGFYVCMLFSARRAPLWFPLCSLPVNHQPVEWSALSGRNTLTSLSILDQLIG